MALQWCFGPSYFPQDKFFLPSFFKHEWTFICEHVVRTFNNWVSLCSTLIIGTYICQHELVTLYVRCCTLSLNIFSLPLRTNVAYHTNKYHTILIRIIAHFCNQFGSSLYGKIIIMEHPVIWSTFLSVARNWRFYTYPLCNHYYHYLHSLAYPIM